MFQTYNQKFNRPMTIIHPGEFFTSTEDLIISTILGSCVSVVLYDLNTRCGGMNHFMLASSSAAQNPYQELTGRYGINAMELLINDLMKLGGKRADFQAKIFGGGHVINTQNHNAIPETNIEFAINFLKEEKIPLVSHDTGGVQGRKIFLFPQTGQVLLKRFFGSQVSRAAQQELDYLESLQVSQRKPVSEITLF